MKPWTTDRPDLERRDRVQDMKRRMADVLNVNTYRVDELLRTVGAAPSKDVKALVAEALANKRAADELRRLLFDLLLEPIAELCTVMIDERIEDYERRANEASESRREPHAVVDQADANDQGRFTVGGELADQADDFGDAWEGPDLF